MVRKGEAGEGEALDFRVLMPLLPSSVRNWLNEDICCELGN